MKRSYYANTIKQFLQDSDSSILGELAIHHEFALEDLQRNAWINQIQILKQLFTGYIEDAFILFEYAIPRMGKRVDVVLLIKGSVFVLEFKVGEKKYSNYAIEQALDYSLDLKNFHEQSHQRHIIPIVVATEAPAIHNTLTSYDDLVYSPLKANKNNLKSVLYDVFIHIPEETLNFTAWQESVYKPTPTIIEAAQALYRGHDVTEISRSDSGAINLSRTSAAISEIIDRSKKYNHKSICFITGVPGAGKTLAGLNIANERHNTDVGEHAVFLSGNGPLVMVLQEALARNEVKDSKNTASRITKKPGFGKNKSIYTKYPSFS